MVFPEAIKNNVVELQGKVAIYTFKFAVNVANFTQAPTSLSVSQSRTLLFSTYV